MRKEKGITINLSEIQEGLELYIDTNKDNALFINEEINNHEAKYQLVEGCFYDYTFSNTDFRLNCSNNEMIVRPRKRDQHSGRIAPNIFVGTLILEVYSEKDASKKGDLPLEVQSIKTSYREDYQFMLNEIAEKCTDLILQANSPVNQTFETDPNCDNQTLYQRFAFIKAMVASEDFDNAVQRIVSSTTTKWTSEEVLTDVRRIKRFSAKNIRQVIHGSNRMNLPLNHSLRQQHIKSIATKIESTHKKESVDTPENRFVKHALHTFLRFFDEIQIHKNAGKRLKEEAKHVGEILDAHLQQNIFKEISKPSTLKLNSPILQKKEGYREILKVWLNFDLAAKLIWSGGDEVYSGGKKDIATLYEYWLFFKLLDVIEKLFEIKPEELDKIIKPSKDGLSLQIKQGDFTAIDGIYSHKNRDLNIRFNYNRSFKFKENASLGEAGSWTTTLRPDYTISIWPKELLEVKAEKEEQIVHIHFDAKYKVANIHQIIDNRENADELNEEKKENLEGIYKNGDLLKMHAYKDAIKRTGGAYVLYPGDKSKKLKGFHEILPGLGAFPVKPTKGKDSTLYLESFLKDVLSHFLNRASQRENIATKRYEIIKNTKPKSLHEPIPEYIDNKKTIPDETYVLVGYTKTKKQLEWYKKEKLYNFRMNDEKGSLRFDEKVVKAKFLLLRENGKPENANILFKLKEGVRVFTKERLAELGHPEAEKDSYLIYDIITEHKELEFAQGISWNFKKLEEYKECARIEKNTRTLAGTPFIITLTELMHSREK